MKKLLLLAALFITGTAAAQMVTGAAQAQAVDDPQPIYDQEGIQSFHANIVIYPTGLINVTEKIKVYAAGVNIRKGIFRNIPLYRRDMYGRNVHTGIHVTDVRKNGQSEPYNESEKDGDLVIRIGDADVDLHEGVYEYDITYESRGQVGFFDGYDELYWNVTGSNWQFPIEKASAAVTLPSGAQVLQTACYTGPAGSTEKDCSMVTDSSGTPAFHASQRLEPGSGFTIAVGFTPGIITRPPPPTAMEKFWSLLVRYRAYVLAALGSILMFGYCFVTWRKHGKDPEKPVVVPTFEPPDNLSPGAIRYLYKRKADNTGFTAAIVSMAIKKAIHIKKDGSRFTLEKSEDPATKLAKEERAAFTKLFNGRASIKVTDSNHRAFSAAEGAFSDSLGMQHNLKSYYLSNTRQIVIGGIITGLMLFGYLLAIHLGEFLMLLFVTPFVGVGTGVLIAGIRSLRKSGCMGVFMIIFGSLFTLGPLSAVYMIMHEANMPWIAPIFIAALLAAYIWYVYLIKAPTELGIGQQARIEGFMMYLRTAEEHRLNMLTPPEHTPALFEKLLPYAIALDLENEWGAKFEQVLELAGYSPDWYEGKPLEYRQLSSSFSSGFISSVGRAQVDPTPPSSSSGSSSSGSSSWSSGSSGGGSSGGGGGGGGGGGW